MSNGVNSQSGFSLIELMVAMAVSLILLAGILQILLGNRESFEAQKAMAGMQQDARLIRFVLDNAVIHAGYLVDLDDSREYVFSDTKMCNTNDTDGGFLHGNNSTSTGAGTGVGSDSLCVRYQASATMVNCLGGLVIDPEEEPGLAKKMAEFELSVDNEGDLQCTVYPDGETAHQPQPLVSNVKTLQIRYGVDTNQDNSVDTYASTPSNWSEVRTVRLQLLLVSADPVLPTDTKQTFELASGTSVSLAPGHAGLLVNQTTALRNLLP